jgi:hypothetical protein
VIDVENDAGRVCRHRGVSNQAINKLVKAGKIAFIVKDDGRR